MIAGRNKQSYGFVCGAAVCLRFTCKRVPTAQCRLPKTAWIWIHRRRVASTFYIPAQCENATMVRAHFQLVDKSSIIIFVYKTGKNDVWTSSFVVTLMEATMKLISLVISFTLICIVFANDSERERDGRSITYLFWNNKLASDIFFFFLLVLPIFQVVRFPNDRCTGTTRNGTCFTA